MIKVIWDDEKLQTFRQMYPYHTSKEIAEYFGLSESYVKKKGRNMGLRKAPFKADASLIQLIKDNFCRCSFSEIANLAGKPRSRIVRLAAALGLKRDTATNTTIRSKVRTNLIRRERIRLKLGFTPLTNIRLISDTEY